MYFADLSELIAMGGHGLYVWTAYGLALLVFIFNLLMPLVRRKRFMTLQARQQRREQIHASDS